MAQRKNVKRRIVALADREIITLGGHGAFWGDAYHHAMTVSTPFFLAASFVVYLTTNLIFGFLYFLDPVAVASVDDPRFLNLIFFSVEAFTTVGFGNMHPDSLWGHIIYTLEGFTSLIEVAALTGLIFARFSRPKARLLFATNPVIALQENQPQLMIRLANTRQNSISDAKAKLWLLRTETSPEGQRYRRFYELPLRRAQSPNLILSWTLFHPITPASPLYGVKEGDAQLQDIQLIVTITGHDETSAQNLHARHQYAGKVILFNQRHADILSVDENGKTVLDYGKFHDTRAA